MRAQPWFISNGSHQSQLRGWLSQSTHIWKGYTMEGRNIKKVESVFKNIDNLLSQWVPAQRKAGRPASGLIAWENWKSGMSEMPMKMNEKEEVGDSIWINVLQVWDLGFRADQVRTDYQLQLEPTWWLTWCLIKFRPPEKAHGILWHLIDSVLLPYINYPKTLTQWYFYQYVNSSLPPLFIVKGNT